MSSPNFEITNSHIVDSGSQGMLISSSNAFVTGVTFSENSGYGLDIDSSGTSAFIADNVFTGSEGLVCYGDGNQVINNLFDMLLELGRFISQSTLPAG